MIRRKTGTATNSRLWNWLAVPGLPTVQFASLWPCASKPLHPLTLMHLELGYTYP
jgi:hypothetical protein